MAGMWVGKNYLLNRPKFKIQYINTYCPFYIQFLNFPVHKNEKNRYTKTVQFQKICDFAARQGKDFIFKKSQGP